MTLTQARSMCDGIINGDYAPVADHRSLEALARWMMRFTPVVCPAAFEQCGNRPPEFAVWLDVGGCERLYGGLDVLMNRVIDELSRLRIDARAAIAPTAGAAWAMAAYAPTCGVVADQCDLPNLLDRAPLEVLRLEERIIFSLNHLGMTTVGQLVRLPRQELPSRFGGSLLRRLDQAMGILPEPLTPLVHHKPIVAAMEFDGSFGSLDAVFAVFHELIDQIVKQLAQRGCGIRQLRIELLRLSGAPIVRTLGLSRPSRHRGNLFNLFQCCLDTLQRHGAELYGKSGRRCGDMSEEGICGLRLSVPVFEPLLAAQAMLDDAQDTTSEEVSHLVERLRTRMGESAVLHAVPVQSHIPERAYRLTTTLHDTKLFDRDGGQRCFGPRPLHLLERPCEIRVMVSPSDDRDGRPVAATIHGRVRRFVHAVGPERLSGEWWNNHDKTRDYFDVQTDEGDRLWVFRVNETYRWYWHGSF